MVDLLLVTATWIHILSAIFYLGSFLALQFIFLPMVLKQTDDSKAQTISLLGKRIGLAGEITSALLVITGLYLAFANNALAVNALLNTSFGNILVLKVILFIVFAGLAENISMTLKRVPTDLGNEKLNEILKKVQLKQYINIVIGFGIILLATGLRYTPMP